MRVITGKAKGRRLKSVRGMNTRPTSDRVKEAMFAILGNTVVDAMVLDLFAGTGGLGIEALSRGAKFCIFVDKDRRAISVIRDNLSVTGFDKQAWVLPVDALASYAKIAQRGYAFDLVFADPPYWMDVAEKLLAGLQRFSLLKPGGIVVYEHDAGKELPAAVGNCRMARQQVYGDTQLTIYVNEV